MSERTYIAIDLKSFFVKFERKLPALVDEFCTYYAAHQNKTVIFYYDSTALGSNYAVNEQDFHYIIVNEFQRHGWEVVDVYLGNPMKHDEKYLLIRSALATLDTSRTVASQGSSG